MEEENWSVHEPTGLVVSDKGRVVIPKTKFTKEHITYGSTNNKGYKQIKFQKKIYLVHRLIAETFLENPHHLPYVNHKDEDKSNNCIENLEWCTHQYNMTYGTRIQRSVEKQRKTVYQYDRQGVLIKEWVSTMECGRNGYNQGNVAACCRGVLPHYKGFVWSYEEKT